MVFLWIFLGLACISLIGLAMMYNRFVKHRMKVNEAWSGVEVQLKRRHDLIPNLVKTVQHYAAHEKTLFEDIVASRQTSRDANDPEDIEVAENKISQGIDRMFALSEDYPELSSNENFMQLSGELVKTEDQIQMARRYYNGTVRDYNIQCESFPSSVLGSACGFQSKRFFEVDSGSERAAPIVDLG